MNTPAYVSLLSLACVKSTKYLVLEEGANIVKTPMRQKLFNFAPVLRLCSCTRCTPEPPLQARGSLLFAFTCLHTLEHAEFQHPAKYPDNWTNIV